MQSEGSFQVTHRGSELVLGMTEDQYSIRQADRFDDEVKSFPLTDEGWRAAWRAFVALEPDPSEVPDDASVGGAGAGVPQEPVPSAPTPAATTAEVEPPAQPSAELTQRLPVETAPAEGETEPVPPMPAAAPGSSVSDATTQPPPKPSSGRPWVTANRTWLIGAGAIVVILAAVGIFLATRGEADPTLAQTYTVTLHPDPGCTACEGDVTDTWTFSPCADDSRCIYSVNSQGLESDIELRSKGDGSVAGTYSEQVSCDDGSSTNGILTITVRGDETAISGDARGSGGCAEQPYSEIIYSFSGRTA